VDGKEPVRQEMMRGQQLADANSYIYRVQVPSTRPTTDYTPRVIPHRDGVAVPLEAARILWQR
jgi:starch phosphorylase